MERIYSIYEAKTKLSELLRFIKNSGRAIITDRGRPVAQVLSLDEKPKNLKERIKVLEQSGLLSKSSGKISNIQPIKRVRGGLKRFLDERD